MTDTTTRLLTRVRAMVERGERISESDAVQLLGVRDTIALARIARIPRERRWGSDVFYPGHPVVEFGDVSVDERLSILDAATERTFILRVGERTSAEALASLREDLARRGWAATPHLTATHISSMAKERGCSTDVMLQDLSASGSLVVTGEGAEIFDSALRAAVAPGVITPQDWTDVHRAAHRKGIPSGAAMTYLTHEEPEAYAAHLATLRELQDETAGFSHFVPLPVHNRAESASFRAVPTAGQTLRIVAISRIVLDNIPHIAIPSGMVGTEIALIALGHGADTLDLVMRSYSVRSQETAEGAGVIALPIIDDAISAAAVQLDTGLQQQIEEARFHPVALDATLAEPAVAAGR